MGIVLTSKQRTGGPCKDQGVGFGFPRHLKGSQVHVLVGVVGEKRLLHQQGEPGAGGREGVSDFVDDDALERHVLGPRGVLQRQVPSLALHQHRLIEYERMEGAVHVDLDEVAEVCEVGGGNGEQGGVGEQEAVDVGVEAVLCEAEERPRVGGGVALGPHQHAVHHYVRHPCGVLCRGPDHQGGSLCSRRHEEPNAQRGRGRGFSQSAKARSISIDEGKRASTTERELRAVCVVTLLMSLVLMERTSAPVSLCLNMLAVKLKWGKYWLLSHSKSSCDAAALACSPASPSPL